MMRVKRAFRVFGAFRYHVPTKASDYNWNAEDLTCGNLLEVFFVQSAPREPWRACARISYWTEEDLPSLPEPDALPEEAVNIFNAERFDQIINQLKHCGSVQFWICKPTTSKPKMGHRLRLYGCAALDQFDDPEDDYFERFALQTKYDYKGSGVGSVVTFGANVSRRGIADLRLQLGFPTAPGLGVAASTISILNQYPTTKDDTGKPEKKLVWPYLTYLTAAGKRRGGGRLPAVPFGRLHFGPRRDYDKYQGQLKAATGGITPIHTEFLRALGIETRSRTSRQEHMEIRGGKPGDKPCYAIAHRTTLTSKGSLSVLGAEQPSFEVGEEVINKGNSRKISIETIATCDLSNLALLQPSKAEIVWDFHCSIRWTALQSLHKGAIPAAEPDTNPLKGGGLQQIAWMSKIGRDGLVATTSQPQSILPELTYLDSDSKLKVPLITYVRDKAFLIGGTLGKAPTIALLGQNEFHENELVPLATTLDTKSGRPPVAERYAPEGSNWQQAPKPKEDLELEMRLPLLMDRSELAKPGPAFPVVFTHHPKVEADGADNFLIVIRIANPEKLDAGSPLKARLGALALDGAKKLLYDSDKLPSEIILRAADRPTPDLLPDAMNTPRLSMDMSLDLALTSAQPVTVDIPHGDRAKRPSALLIRETSSVDASTTRLRLQLTERLQDDQDRHLVGDLWDVTPDQPGSENVVVLANEPFSVYRYKRQPFEESGGEDSSLVATYDSDLRQWKRKPGSDTYLMMRPPGVVGEDADKPGVLELHDAEVNETLRPALLPMNGVPRRIALGMRLSPPSALWIRPTDLSRNFVLPEYAAREIFRQKGDFGLGVQLAGLRSEALYGLAFGILVPPPSKERPTPRIAEIETLVGRMLSAKNAGGRWEDLYLTFRKRSEHLEIWTLDPSAQSPFVPAHFDAEARFSLRHTALLAPPVGDVDGVTPTRSDTPKKLEPPRFAEHGLAGGALWPVESSNLVRELAGAVTADGGSLNRIALSPMGLSADQSVTFLNGRVKILSETREGRLHKQRVEVLGRIGALWHRAKHVVVYERTTAPSDQFSPDKAGTRSARAVLRKAREFVEVLEPIRRYPDVAGVAPNTRGFVSSVRFNSKIINVNSAWGGDIGTTGWQVPLWNRGESEERPQVYPHPDIAFVTRCEGRNEMTETSQECRDPHLLYFYTETGANSSANSDLWPSREEIDYSVMGFSQIQFEGEDNFRGQVDIAEHPLKPLEKTLRAYKRRVASSRLPFGMRRFTWRLAPSPIRTQINAERGDKPVFAGLESVTFMRSFDLSLEDEELKEIKETLISALELGEIKLREGVTLPNPIGSDLPQATPNLQAIKDAVAKMGKYPTVVNADDVIEKISAYNGKVNVSIIAEHVLGADYEEQINDLGKALRGNTLAKNLNKLDGKDCEEISERAAKALKRRKLLVLETIRDSETRVLAKIRDSLIKDKAVIQRLLKEDITAEISAVTSDLGAAIGSVMDGLAIARSTVNDWQADSLAALARVQARVDETANALDRLKPWSRNRLNQALAQLEQVYDGAEREAEAALNEARQRLATEINGAARSVSGVIGASIASVLEANKQKALSLEGIAGQVERQAATILAAFDKIPNQQDARFDKIRAKVVASNNTTLKDAFELTRQAVEGLSALRSRVETAAKFATEGDEDLKAAADDASKKVVVQLKDVDDIVSKLETFAQTAADEGFENIKDLTEGVKGAMSEANAEVQNFAVATFEVWADWLDVIDSAIDGYAARIDTEIARVDTASRAGFAAVEQWLKRFENTINDAQEKVPTALQEAVVSQVVIPALDKAFDNVIWPDPDDEDALKSAIERVLRGGSVEAEVLLDKLNQLAEGGLAKAKEACAAVMGAKEKLFEEATNVFDAYRDQLEEEVKPQIGKLRVLKDELKAIKQNAEYVENYAKKLTSATKDIDEAVEGIGTEVAAVGEHARAYYTGGLERAGDLFEGKSGAVPGKALELISFLSHSPEIANIKTNADRVRMYVDKTKKALNTPEIHATLDYLGDALKALGLEFDFEEITDAFEMKLPNTLKLSDLIPSFGGIDLRNLLPSTLAGSDVKKFVKLTHDLDTKAGRAWVLADVNLPLSGREPLFTSGPFTLYITKSNMTAFMRAEASKDSSDVTVTERAILKTDLEAVVSGQVLVTLKDALITYSRESDLDFKIDPRKIRIHKAMQFVQDMFGSIFGDEDSGLTFLRDGDKITGVQHKFSLPPMSLNFATSGVSNIAISNRFALRAYPDFKIANQFNLSRRELPFVFSIFIIGGTGYLQVDTDYRPTDGALTVAVEAGLGGSAAFAFSLGPVSGGVYITLSVVLRYVKRIGRPSQSDDGLSVSLVLVIAGNVSLWGMVTIYLGLMLSINYHESGRIDAMGSLSVEVRISRWFKLKYSTSVTYKLRDGKSTQTRTEELSTSGKAKEAFNNLDKLNKARKSL
jgi:hypothetical protein